MKYLYKLLIVAVLTTVSNSTAHAQFLKFGKNPTVAKVGNEKIKLQELESFYKRNNPENSADPDDLKEFVTAYSLYRAKLLEGKSKGLHLDETFLKEIEEFESKAAPAYWIEKSLKETLLEEFIERSKTEYLVSHVLVRLDENASPSDTLEAYQTLLKAREEYLEGASMDSLNQVYSTRIRNNPIGGDIPWFSAGTTVYDFENVVYTLEPGQISLPVRSQFGYHIILVKNKRPRTPGYFVSHIFFREDSLSKSRIDSAVSKLSNGEEWESVALEYSDDRQSALNGGSIGLVGYNLRFPEEFSTAVLNLDSTLKWSEPIKTAYGTHIFRIDSIEQIALTDQRISQLEEQLRQLPRYKLDEEDVVTRIRDSEYVKWLQPKSDATSYLQRIYVNEDSTGFENYQVTGNNLSETKLIQIIDQIYDIDDFVSWIQHNQADLGDDATLDYLVELFVESMIKDSIGSITAYVYPEYAITRNQFYNGLLVFKVNELNIWDPEKVDSARVRKYFDENIQYYRSLSQEISVTDTLSTVDGPELSDDQLFEKIYFRIFSDMQTILENEYHQYLTNKYRIRQYPNRI